MIDETTKRNLNRIMDRYNEIVEDLDRLNRSIADEADRIKRKYPIGGGHIDYDTVIYRDNILLELKGMSIKVYEIMERMIEERRFHKGRVAGYGLVEIREE